VDEEIAEARHPPQTPRQLWRENLCRCQNVEAPSIAIRGPLRQSRSQVGTYGKGSFNGYQQTILGRVYALLVSKELFQGQRSIPAEHCKGVTNFMGSLSQ
jgi:hypothetical protein